MNRIEQRMVRQEWESRNEIPILRTATLAVLAIIAAGLMVLLVHLLPPLKALLWSGLVATAAWPLFALGRRHARLIRRPGPGNIQ